VKPFDIPNDALQVMPENAYWRDVANYDRVIAKLYFYLKPLNWQPIEAAHATGWHKQGVQSIRKRYDDCQDSYPWVAFDRIYDSRYERFKGCIRTTSLVSIQKGSRGLVQLNYIGRLIRRDVLQGAHHARRFAELTLPIPAPAAYAQRQMQTAWHLWAKVLAQLDEQAQATSPNRREYLAIRLRRISLELSDANTLLSGGLSAWLASGSLREVLKVEKAWLLSPQLEPLDFGTPSWINPPAPDKVGEIRAKVDYFWQCLYDFHEAEIASTAIPVKTVGTVVLGATSSLTHRQLVLLCLYRGQPITKLNCERVAKGLESNAPNVAVVLWRTWEKWGSVLAVRNAKGKRTVIPLIEDMQWVITQLTDEQKKVADNDLRYIMREIN
jgi:hypothetical protein